MFGRARRRATAQTIELVRPLIAVYQSLNGLPAGFWRDEFVLGFIGFMISFHVNNTVRIKLSQADKGYLLFDVFTALSNMNGQAIARDYTRLATESPRSLDFEKGEENAMICAHASMGRMSPEGEPYYEIAKEMAAAQGAPEDLGAIIASLLHVLFYEPLEDRFGSG